MRALDLMIALVAMVAVVLLGYLIWAEVAGRRRRRLAGRARWQVRHFGDGRETVVAVSLTLPGGDVVEDHTVARIPDGHPDWTPLFLAAREQAEERAFHLNGGTQALP